MPRLQILQHKSYHPYLESNKQRVRDDEAKATALEAQEERAALDQNASSRLAYLRDKDSLPVSTSSRLIEPPDASALLAARRSEKIRADKREERARLEFDWPREGKRGSESGRTRERKENGDVVDGHLNFWAGLEKSGTKPKKTPDQIQADDPTTMYLDRPLRETKPWYTDVDLRTYEEREEDDEKRERRERRRRKDESAKVAQDPMSEVQAALGASSSSSMRPPPARDRYQRASITDTDDPLRAARTNRESAERARALALVRASRAGGGETPRTDRTDGYEEGNLWNAREVREARRRKEAVRGWRRGVGADEWRR